MFEDSSVSVSLGFRSNFLRNCFGTPNAGRLASRSRTCEVLHQSFLGLVLMANLEVGVAQK